MVELKEELQVRPRTRTEISAEVYAQLQANLRAALEDLKALRSGIPCWLSAPATLAARVEKHLALIQGAIGSIEIVREDLVEEKPSPAPSSDMLILEEDPA